ncbi:MFS transporter [Myroides odoratimimus]|uniref:MFS transporter n=1 Tax=Myroides odoratimimus TaxID=76832 RepID=UPI003100D7BB
MNIIKKWNNVIILSSAQALFQTASILVMTLSGIVGLKLASDESLATLPISVISVGTAIMMIPASFIIKKIGQKKAFMIGTLIGVLAGCLSFYAINTQSFLLFIFGNMLIGCYQGFAQYYRFAAADSVDDLHKGKAISFVIAGGVVAALAGPNLAKYTQHLGEVQFAFSFLSITTISILSLLLLFGLKTQKELKKELDLSNTTNRPLLQIIKQRKTVAALISSAVGYSVMIMIMTATPIAMHHCGYASEESATVIQWHVLGMFVPSFFTGGLIQKFGAKKIVVIGIVILFLHVFFALSGTDFFHFVSGLILLGIGWNFMFIGGSTILSKVYFPLEKEKTQAFHDFFVFGIISISSLSAGTLLNAWGWKGVNIAVIPMLTLALFTILLFLPKAKNVIE